MRATLMRRWIWLAVAAGPALWAADDAALPVYEVEKLPPKDFTVVAQPPFVVIGDEPANVVRDRATGTVQWAVRLLKKDFFEKDPPETLRIWMFKDRASYEKHTMEFFGEPRPTALGYHSARHDALFLDIGSGTGTLVHEIVHPYLAANFSDCPPWFNEGLASLFEQCRERDGRLVGLTNWRLPGLQETIAERKLPSLEQLMALDAKAFYGAAHRNYAQARYLCYYLQERGLLVKYYRQFLARRESDPTGYATLQEVLGRPDMAKFQREWEQFVLKLKYP